MYQYCRLIPVGFLICFTLALMGCRSHIEPIPPSSTPVYSNEANLTPDPTRTPTPTKTSQPIPSVIPTSTTMVLPQPTFTQTLTPLPTLLPDEALELVQELLRTNMGCQFPCWWGITPGISTWANTRNYIKTFAFRLGEGRKTPTSDKNLSYSAYFPLDAEPTLMNSLMGTFTVDPDSGVIRQISTSQNFSLLSFLESYGVPEQVWLTASGIPQTGPAAYAIELIYPSKGIMAGPNGHAQLFHREDGDITTVCLETLRNDARGLTFWTPEDQEIFKKIIDLYNAHRYKPLEEVTGMKIEEFMEILTKGDANDCLEIPMRIWYPP